MASFHQRTLPNELESPFTKLIDGRWFDLFLQKLNDYDSLSEKKKKLNSQKAASSSQATDPPQAEAKAEAKKKGKAKGGAAATTAAEADVPPAAPSQ